MSAPVRIEGGAWNDPRFVTLGRLIGKDSFSALARMGWLWAQCTNRQSHTLTAAVVAGALECDVCRAGDILRECELGEVLQDGSIRLRGTEGRIEWLGERRRASAKGGETTKLRAQQGRKRAPRTKSPPKQGPNEGQTEANQGPSEGQAEAKPEPNGGPLISGLLSIGSNVSVPTEPTQSAAPPAKVPVHEFIGWFTERFQAHHAGAKPTWDPKSTGKVKRLLGLHGLDELKRRADVMFAMAPKFPATNPSVTTLERGIDDFAGPNATGPPGRVGHFKATDDIKYAGGEVKL